MKKHFYYHLINIEPLQTTLDQLNIVDVEKNKLISLVESTTHYVVIDCVLGELNETDSKKFLSHLAQDKHIEIWKLLNTKIERAEEKIKKAIRDTHMSMIDDAHKVVKNK